MINQSFSMTAQGLNTDMTGSQLVLLALAIGGLTLLMLSTRKKMVQRAKETAARPKVKDRAKQLETQGRMRRDLDQVMIELDQLSRQIHARIDTKFAKLEAVIRDADERIEQLSELNRRASGALRSTVAPEPKEDRLNIVLDEQEPGRAISPPKPDRPVSRRSAYDEVYQLDDSGLSAEEIAAKTGKQTGEIELILSLRSAKA